LGNREKVANFGRQRLNKHWEPNLLGGIKLCLAWNYVLFSAIPQILAARRWYRHRKPNPQPRFAIFSDNLDETNGIAVNARLLTQEMHKQGKDFHLIGIGFHTRDGGLIEKSGTVLLPPRYSMEQLGYDQSELAIPSLDELFTYLKRYPIDALEVETPSSAGTMILLIAKIIGIPVYSHYRTDLVSYTYALVKSKIMKFFIIQWVKLFCKASTPIIVPSDHFKEKLQEEYGIAEQDIVKLPRGINLEDFSPDKNQGLWKSYAPEKETVRFLFVGRVSKEKELEFLEKIWRSFRKNHDNLSFLVVGDGPYKAEMETRLSDCPEVVFTGKQSGNALSSLYAEAHFLIFPSGTDTFGNVVVESIASGTPVLVSDSGGPKDIAIDQKTGSVITFKSEADWLFSLEKAYDLVGKPLDYQNCSQLCVESSKQYSIANSAQAFWEFFLNQISKK
jgi:glycosyltransferase involved in cell wall biosynthesis